MQTRRFIELALFKVRADLKAESAKTYIGMLWWILDPLMWMAAFYLVFAVLLERRTEQFTDFLLCGLVFWRWFAGTISNSSMSIKAGKGLMQQIYIPKEFFVVVNILKDLFKFALIFVLLLVYLLFRGYSFDETLAALPLLMAIQLLLVVGTTFFVASVIPLLPDLKFVLDNVLLIGMFLSGIFYDGRDLPAAKQELFYLNPIAKLIESYRVVLLEDSWPDFGALLLPLGVSAGLLITGITIIRTLDRDYPRIVQNR